MRKVYFKDQLYHLPDGAQINDQVNLELVQSGTFENVKLDSFDGLTVLATYPSVDTRVCDLQIIRLASMSLERQNVRFIGVSMDLPSAIDVYNSNHPIEKMKLYSDYKTRKLAEFLGVLINEYQLCARSIFVLDKDNKIIYKQVNENTHEQVDFDSLEKFLDSAI